jgi:DNA-binding transcriptional MerR regulator
MENNLSIKDLENLSGIKAHTIRVWEKRYNFIQPQRTATNIRFYLNNDLKKLLNVTALMNSGMKISKAAILETNKLNEAIENLQKTDLDTFEKLLVNDLIIATLNCDIIMFEKHYSDYHKKYGFESTVENILYPLLTRIGLLWTVNKMNISQEHFSSQLIKQKLFAAINEIPIKTSTTKFLLFLPEKQHHEIGLLYAHYLIRKSGVQSVYLGSSVPLSDVKICSEKIKPTHILCSFTIPLAKDKMSLYLRKTSNLFKDNNVLVHNASIDKLTKRSHPYLSFLSTIEDLKKILLRSIDFESVEGLKLQCKDS